MDLESKPTNAEIGELVAAINEKNSKIDLFEERIIQLEAKKAFQANMKNLLERKIDYGKQYQRRLNLIINGITCDTNKRNSNQVFLMKVKNKVSKLRIGLMQLHPKGVILISFKI